MKAEYLLPTIIGDLLAEKKLAVKVLTSKDKWFGVTYKEDKDSVVSELQALIHAGVIRKSYSEIKIREGRSKSGCVPFWPRKSGQYKSWN